MQGGETLSYSHSLRKSRRCKGTSRALSKILPRSRSSSRSRRRRATCRSEARAGQSSRTRWRKWVGAGVDQRYVQGNGAKHCRIHIRRAQQCATEVHAEKIKPPSHFHGPSRARCRKGACRTKVRTEQRYVKRSEPLLNFYLPNRAKCRRGTYRAAARVAE